MLCQISDKKKFFNDDTVFNKINRTFVSLQDSDKRDINVHLNKVIDKLISMMMVKDSFFEKIYQRMFFGGSYYKGTKVGAPEEFDLNIIIKLPINYDNMKVKLCTPGYVKIYSGLQPNTLMTDGMIERNLRLLLDKDMYLHQEKFRHWIESILSRTLNTLPLRNGYSLLTTDTSEYKIKVTKTGPAFTLHIKFFNDKVITVDLVPVLELTHNLQDMKYNLRSFQKKNWFAVPKPLKKQVFYKESHLYWRTCFYEQEKEILTKHGKIKPVLRQMKKLRDTQNWKNIASYYIETVFLHALQTNLDLQKESCTYLFLMMLNKMHIALQNHYIPYYWDEDYNLLDTVKHEETMNIERRLGNIISIIIQSIEINPYIIAKFVLSTKELQLLQNKQFDAIENKEESSDTIFTKCTII